jgi:uncharacterized protein (DUF58 family)
MPAAAEKYLKPEVINQIRRLDLRAQMMVKGFLQGMHASPYHGFSVQFSEHRRYNPGDDPKLIDWMAYAKSDRYFVKRYEAETNLTGFLVMDLSRSMGYTYRQELTKFQYSICLAAALTYLMVSQQDPIGLITFDDKVRARLPARSRRGHLADVLGQLARLEPSGQAHFGPALFQIGSLLRHQSLVMIFSDLLDDVEQIHAGLIRLRHSGHDVILFHVMDEAEVHFPFSGPMEFFDPETNERISVDASGHREDYLKEIEQFRSELKSQCHKARIDYVPLDTSMPFDRALTEYLVSRRGRF